ncbi:hypothetical protein SFC76_05400 [Sphingomonas sp. CD22]|uniref:hypothetical protein n=1 Tax=Sphingomonas sp. CD22 TaxID=3100214 RepID=UPI002ADF1D37|nr:hypothetical protein [Sphingomonas sp. CD22]MEA1083689.1 hypothetical protein [Sphingomonas sp. CD22]
MQVVELNADELEAINGGFSATHFIWGTLGVMAGGGIAAAGLGTPISIAGAALAGGSASIVAASFYE